MDTDVVNFYDFPDELEELIIDKCDSDDFNDWEDRVIKVCMKIVRHIDRRYTQEIKETLSYITRNAKRLSSIYEPGVELISDQGLNELDMILQDFNTFWRMYVNAAHPLMNEAVNKVPSTDDVKMIVAALTSGQLSDGDIMSIYDAASTAKQLIDGEKRDHKKRKILYTYAVALERIIKDGELDSVGDWYDDIVSFLTSNPGDKNFNKAKNDLLSITDKAYDLISMKSNGKNVDQHKVDDLIELFE